MVLTKLYSFKTGIEPFRTLVAVCFPFFAFGIPHFFGVLQPKKQKNMPVHANRFHILHHRCFSVTIVQPMSLNSFQIDCRLFITNQTTATKNNFPHRRRFLQICILFSKFSFT